MKPGILLACFLLTHCSSPNKQDSESSFLETKSNPETSPVNSEGSEQSAELSYHSTHYKGSKVHFVLFDQRAYYLDVADQESGPGSRWTNAQHVAQEYNGLAAINAGFFTPEGKPLGLVKDGGIKRGYLNRSSLGSGIYFYHPNNGGQIIRRAKLKNQDSQELLQAGPFLVENGKFIADLKKSKPRPRSFLAHDGKNHWLIGYAENLSMHDLATLLSSPKLTPLAIDTALNLDGGRSSQLYISSKITKSSAKQVSSFMPRKVRNFLILKKRPTGNP